MKSSKKSKKAKQVEVVEAAEQELALEASEEVAEEIIEEGVDELAEFGSTNIFTEPEPESFLPEVSEEVEAIEASEEEATVAVDGTELDAFDSAEIEEVEFVEEERLDSILESILFASDRPVSFASIKQVFKGTNVKNDHLRRAIDRLAIELADGRRGVSLEEVPGGYQIRTKVDNMNFLARTVKSRPFRLSGPAMEVMAIVAYKQPLIKAEIDEIRGVESGHLLRALMEKGLVNFEGKSDLPGKPMLYGSTKKFLEIFGLRSLKELPTLSQIDELLPEGIGEEVEEKPKLADLTDSLSQQAAATYSEGEEELGKISAQLESINTSSDFFEEEKKKQKRKREAEKAQGIRDGITLGEEISTRDRNWLTKYDEALAQGFGSVDEMDAAKRAEKFAQMQAQKAEEQFETMGEESASAVETSVEFTSEDAVDAEIALEEAFEEEDSEDSDEIPEDSLA